MIIFKGRLAAQDIGQSNQKLGAYLTKVAENGNGAEASIVGYTGSLIKMGAKAAAANVATLALNTALLTIGSAFIAWGLDKIILSYVH